MRHGYKGAFEMAATVDYLFAFAATARAVADHHFDAVFEAYLEDEQVRGFLADNNPAALGEMAERLVEARERGLWKPRSNSAQALLAELANPAMGPELPKATASPHPGPLPQGGRERSLAATVTPSPSTRERPGGGDLSVHLGEGLKGST